MQKLYLNNQPQVSNSNFENLKPRLHVINNLLNYSKSLQVSTMKNGKKVALNLN
jgi:hypothetical protein